jgi:hypothetical protein
MTGTHVSPAHAWVTHAWVTHACLALARLAHALPVPLPVHCRGHHIYWHALPSPAVLVAADSLLTGPVIQPC